MLVIPHRPSLFIGLALFSFGAVAAPLTEAEVADRLKFYRSLSSLDVTFRQTKKLVDAGVEIRSDGRLHLENDGAKKGTVIWEILKPSPVRVTLDPSGVEIVSGTGPTATRQRFSAADMPKGDSSNAASFRSLGAWLKLDAKELSEAYAIESIAASAYRFTPKTAGGPFSKLEMVLGSAGSLETLSLYERSGDELLIRFAKPNVKRSAR